MLGSTFKGFIAYGLWSRTLSVSTELGASVQGLLGSGELMSDTRSHYIIFFSQFQDGIAILTIGIRSMINSSSIDNIADVLLVPQMPLR
jgi:hypothetical protein